LTNDQFRAWLKKPREGHPRGLTQRAAAELLGIAPNRVWAMAREEKTLLDDFGEVTGVLKPVAVSRQTAKQIELLEAMGNSTLTEGANE
jgi:hypothetical protein